MGQGKRRITKLVIAVLTILLVIIGTALICCWGLSYWWFDMAAYIRLKPYPKAVHINATRNHYSDSGTPSFNYILIEQYEISGSSLDQIVAHYKQTMPKDGWVLSREGNSSNRRWYCGPTYYPSRATYVLSWYRSGDLGTRACVAIEPLTGQDTGWRITHSTHHGRMF